MPVRAGAPVAGSTSRSAAAASRPEPCAAHVDTAPARRRSRPSDPGRNGSSTSMSQPSGRGGSPATRTSDPMLTSTPVAPSWARSVTARSVAKPRATPPTSRCTPTGSLTDRCFSSSSTRPQPGLGTPACTPPAPVGHARVEAAAGDAPGADRAGHEPVGLRGHHDGVTRLVVDPGHLAPRPVAAPLPLEHLEQVPGPLVGARGTPEHHDAGLAAHRAEPGFDPVSGHDLRHPRCIGTVTARA